MALSTQEKERIITALRTHGVSHIKCPICNNETSFSVVDGYFAHSLQGDFNNIVLGGQSVPTIGIICSRCGFISQHAIGILGLLSSQAQQPPTPSTGSPVDGGIDAE